MTPSTLRSALQRRVDVRAIDESDRLKASRPAIAESGATPNVAGTGGVIEKLNERIDALERGGGARPGELDALRSRRDEAVRAWTGADDVSRYDVDIVATAQNEGITYNRAVENENRRRRVSNEAAPDRPRRPLLERVEQLPWETPRVNARVDELIGEGLSQDAAITIAITERRPTLTWSDGPFGLKFPNLEQPTIQGGWQERFAERVVRSGAEIDHWASNIADSGTASVNLTAGDDDVTVTQRADGLLVVRDNTGTRPDRLVDPGTVDRVIIRGGNGSDTITIDESVTRSLVVAGGDGDDFIYGGGGNDILVGGDGVDLIRGNGGSDIVIGGAGDDNIEGGSGGDVIVGGRGADYASGGSGNDLIHGGAERDSLYGGRGEDIVLGQGDDDYIDGGRGDDLLDGGDGRDTVSGGKGDDDVRGGSGGDTLIGASGDDVYGDVRKGDRLIREAGESAGTDGASSSVVAIDPSLGDADAAVVAGSRREFRDRVDDDFETLRSLESGQAMLERQAAETARTGNTASIAELDGTRPTQTLPSGAVVATENGFAYTGTGRDVWNTAYGDAPAPGTDSTIYYNPSVNIGLTEATGRENVPPVVVLFHEMSHALNQTGGTGLEGEYRVPGQVDTGVNNVERQAVGLSVSVDHDDDPFTPEVDRPNLVDQPSENDLRRELGIGERVSYVNP